MRSRSVQETPATGSCSSAASSAALQRVVGPPPGSILNCRELTQRPQVPAFLPFHARVDSKYEFGALELIF